jgi:flagellar hook-associated protein FlgK
MIQSLSSQPASLLSGLLSGFTGRDQRGPSLGGTKPNKTPETSNAIASQQLSSDQIRKLRAPDGVPAIVAQAFPDFSQLALGIVDRAGLSTAADGAEAATESKLLTAITGIFGPASGSGSLTDKISTAAQHLADASASPTDDGLRAQAASAIGAVLDHVGTAVSGLNDLARSLDSQIQTETATIQTGLDRLNQANDAVVQARAAGADTTQADSERRAALADLSAHVQLTFQDRPDGALVPVGNDGKPLSDDLANFSADALQAGLSGGRLKALVTARSQTLPDLQRQIRALAAGLTSKLNEAASAPAQSQLTGTNTGLGPDDRLNLTGAATFAVLDDKGQVQSAATFDFSARTRRSLSMPAQGVSVATPAQLVKSVNEALKGQASLSFEKGVFAFTALSDKAKVAIIPADRAGTPRSLTQVTGLGRVVDGPTADTAGAGFQPSDPHEFAAGQTLSLTLTSASGATKTANITLGGRTFQDLMDQVNDRETGLGAYQLLGMEKDGSLTKAFAPDWIGARLTVTSDTTSRANTGRSFSSLFGLDTPTAPRLSAGVATQDLTTGRPVINDKTRRGAAFSNPGDTFVLNRLSAAVSAEVVVPPGLGKPTRVLDLATLSGDIAKSVSTRADAALSRQQDSRAYELALADERGRLSSASFAAELNHLSTLQTARNIGGRLESNANGLLAHLNRASLMQDASISAGQGLAA